MDFPDLTDFAKLTEKKTELTGKKTLTEKGPCLRPTASYKWSMTSVVWNISTGQVGLAAWLCSLPALVHLLIS